MRIFRYRESLDSVPVDLCADPDGEWTYEALVEAAGFDLQDEGIAIGALTDAYYGHPDGSAVVATPKSGFIAIIECVPEPVRLPLPQRRETSPIERAA